MNTNTLIKGNVQEILNNKETRWETQLKALEDSFSSLLGILGTIWEIPKSVRDF
jgi:hypothetical protein